MKNIYFNMLVFFGFAIIIVLGGLEVYYSWIQKTKFDEISVKIIGSQTPPTPQGSRDVEISDYSEGAVDFASQDGVLNSRDEKTPLVPQIKVIEEVKSKTDVVDVSDADVSVASTGSQGTPRQPKNFGDMVTYVTKSVNKAMSKSNQKVLELNSNNIKAMLKVIKDFITQINQLENN